MHASRRLQKLEIRAQLARMHNYQLLPQFHLPTRIPMLVAPLLIMPPPPPPMLLMLEDKQPFDKVVLEGH